MAHKSTRRELNKQAPDIIVDLEGNGNYTDPQEAVDAAITGEWIHLMQGDWHSNLGDWAPPLLITKSIRLTSVGRMHTTLFNDEIDGSHGVHVLNINQCILEHFRVRGPDTLNDGDGFRIEGSNSTTLNDLRAQVHSGEGFHLIDSHTCRLNRPDARECLNGIVIEGDSTFPNIHYGLISTNREWGIDLGDGVNLLGNVAIKHTATENNLVGQLRANYVRGLWIDDLLIGNIPGAATYGCLFTGPDGAHPTTNVKVTGGILSGTNNINYNIHIDYADHIWLKNFFSQNAVIATVYHSANASFVYIGPLNSTDPALEAGAPGTDIYLWNRYDAEKFYDITHSDNWAFRNAGLARLLDGAVDQAGITRKVPGDFISLSEVILAVNNVSGGVGNLYWRPKTAIQANGEAWATHGAAAAYRANALPDDVLTELPDMSGEAALDLDELVRGDYFGIVIERDATHVNDTIVGNVDVLGVLFKYIGEHWLKRY